MLTSIPTECSIELAIRKGPESLQLRRTGEDREWTLVRDGVVFNGWCVTKPILAMAMGMLVDDDLLDIDRSISSYGGRVLDLLPSDLTVRSLLNHNAGLVVPGLWEVLMMPYSRRIGAVLDSLRTRSAEPGYSEYVAWRILAEVAAQLSQQAPEQFVEQRVLGPLGLSEAIVFDCSSAKNASFAAQASAYTMRTPDYTLLSFHDRTGAVTANDRLACGGFTKLGGLAMFYSALGAVLQEQQSFSGLPSAATLHEMVARPLPVPLSGTQTAHFSGGMMTRHSSIPATLGDDWLFHSGLGGTSLAGYCFGTNASLAFFFDLMFPAPALADAVRDEVMSLFYEVTG